MAQEIVTWCDHHMAADPPERVPASPRVVAMDNGKPKVVDLCDVCDKELLEAVRQFMDSFGRPFDTATPPINVSSQNKSPGGERIPCPEGCGYRARRHSYRDHMPQEHGVSLAVWEGRHKRTIEGHETIKYFCEYDCEAGFTTPQGKGAHMSAEHGYTGPQNPVQEPLPDEPAPAKPAAKKTTKKTAAKR